MPKTMAQAEKKSLKTWRIVFGAATVIIFCLYYLNLGNTLFYQYHLAASKGWQWIGAICFGLAIVTLLIHNKITYWFESDTAWYIVWVAFLAVGFFASAGFTFDLK